MDGIDSEGNIVTPPDHTLISEKIQNKGGQGTRPQYYVKKQTPPEPPPEEEVPEEPGKPKHLIDIKV